MEIVEAEQTEDRQKMDDWSAKIAEYYKGHPDIIRLALTAIVADGHVLLEDQPGSGKTLLAKTIAHTIDASKYTDTRIQGFQRIQFTPDLLPMDLLGVNVFNQKTADFYFQPGPVFTRILLVDEINRAGPKVQSALLEVMAEKQVTIDRKSYQLGELFFVIGTENPLEHHGVYPLPLAQLDRFMMRLVPGHLAYDEELALIGGEALRPEPPEPVISIEDILSIRNRVLPRRLPDIYAKLVTDLLHQSRDGDLKAGLSTRAGIHLLSALKVWSALFSHAPGAVNVDDFSLIAHAVLDHRLPESSAADARILTRLIRDAAEKYHRHIEKTLHAV